MSDKQRQVISQPRRRPKLQIQQHSWIQMMMTAMDAPGWLLHKAIPPHQSLRGRVQPSQHNRDKNVAVWPLRCASLLHSFPRSKGELRIYKKDGGCRNRRQRQRKREQRGYPCRTHLLCLYSSADFVAHKHGGAHLQFWVLTNAFQCKLHLMSFNNIFTKVLSQHMAVMAFKRH